jgi:outer membrane protein assembly factor BamB
MLGFCARLLLVGVSLAALESAARCAELKLPKGKNWADTLRRAPRGWERSLARGQQVVMRMREHFPEARAEFFALAASMGLAPRGNARLQFWIVKQALGAGPKGRDRDYLLAALATLHGSFVDPGPALKLAQRVDTSKLDKKTRQFLKGRVAFWKEWRYDILPIGRCYEAEQLMREADEFLERKEYKDAAAKLMRVILRRPNGYYPLKNGAIQGTGARARDRLSALVLKHPAEVRAAAEEVSPGLAARAGAGDSRARVLLARAYTYTPPGWRALLLLGEEDLDAGRSRLAALRFRRCLSLAAGSRSRSEALWRLAMAESASGRGAAAREALAKLVAVKGGVVRIKGKDVAVASAAQMIRKQLPPVQQAVSRLPGVSSGSILKPRMVFTSQPAYWDLAVRCTWWPRFWKRPESEPVIDGDRVYLHDSANMWALDWRKNKLLWHYRSPAMLLQNNFRGRSYSNQINEARLTGRGYSVGVARGRVCARFRTRASNLWYQLRCLYAKDGRLLWTTAGNPELKGLSFASSPVGANDRFYALAFTPIHTSGAFLVCLRPKDGKVLWRTQVGSGVDSWGSDIGNLFSAHGGISVAGGQIYLSSDRGCFASVDALDGSLLWVSGTDRIYEKGSWVGTRGHTTRADVGSMVERAHSAPVIGKKSVYCLAKDSAGMFALERNSGRRRFVQLPRTVVEVVGESGGVVVAAWHGGLFGLKADNGEVAWERNIKMGHPWRSGFMSGGKVYWPLGGELLILSAASGKELGRARLETPELATTLRLLPDGSIAALSSSGPVDQFSVLSVAARKTKTVLVAEETPGARTHLRSLGVAHPQSVTLGRAPLKRPPLAPIPPVELLWRADFSPEQIFTCRYPVSVLGSPPRLLVGAGNELHCYRLDARGARLWKTPVGPAPKHMRLWSGERVCVQWSNGFDLVDLNSGKRVWGWSGWPLWGASEASKQVAVVWTRTNFAGVSMPEGKILWTRRIVNNAWGINAVRTPWGALTFVRQDKDYGGRSYLDMTEPASGKVKWSYKFPRDTYCRQEGNRFWGWSRSGDRVSLVEAGEKGAREIWNRKIPGGGRVVFDADRILVVKERSGVTVLDRISGKDALPRINEKITGFVAGPRVYTYRAKGRKYKSMVVVGMERASGKRLWEWSTGGGAPPESTASQVLVQGGSPITSFWSRYYRHPSPARVTSLTSMDVRTGRLLGRFGIPGRDLDTSTSRGYQRNVIERNNLLVLRTEGGVAVLGSAGLRPPSRLRSEIALLEKQPAGIVRDRRISMLRESVMRYTPPTTGAERCDTPPYLDGEFDDWEGAAWVKLGRVADWVTASGGALSEAAKAWKGPRDCSARFALRQDGRTLYVAVEVRDDDFSPPVGTGESTPGDCVELGISLSRARADCLGTDHNRNHPDMKVRLARIKGRAVATRVWYGSGSRVAISSRSGTTRYEAAIPFRGGRLRLARPDAVGFSLRVVDADGGQPRGSMRWAGGLRDMGSSARFGSAVLAPLSREGIAEGLRLAQLLPDSGLAGDLLYDVARSRLSHGHVEAARRDFEKFLRANPGAHQASRALAWYAYLSALTGKAGVFNDPGKLFPELKIPEVERSEARGRLFVRVRLPKGRRPTNLGFGVEIRKHPRDRGLWRGIYWGRRRELLAGNMLWAGALPTGNDVELSVPYELLGLANRMVTAVDFRQYEGTAWWGDFGVIDAAGKRHALIPATAECKARHSNWAGGKAPDGKSGHWAANLGIGWTSHRFVPPRGKRRAGLVASSQLASANYKLEQAGGTLPRKECLQAAEVIPEKRLVVELLRAVNDGKATADFIRRHPNSRQVLGIMEMLARGRHRDIRAIPGQLLKEGVIRREVARSYYLRRAAGVSAWQAVGPFSNEADVALRRPYGPEKNPSLKATYRGQGGKLGWVKLSTERGGYVNLGATLKASDFQCGYAVAWVKAEKPRRAWCFLSTANVISLWVNAERIMENADPAGGRSYRRGRYARSLQPVPVTLRKGWNRLLVKCAGRWGYLGFKLHLGEPNAAPLAGLKYSTDEPAAVK